MLDKENIVSLYDRIGVTSYPVCLPKTRKNMPLVFFSLQDMVIILNINCLNKLCVSIYAKLY